MAAVTWLGSADRWLDVAYPSDRPSLRRAAAATPTDGPLEEFLTFVTAVRSAGQTSTDIDRARSELAALRVLEPDLDSPGLPIDGRAVAAILGVEPGPLVGRAMARLREYRFDHGPFAAEVAAELLRPDEG